MVARCIGHWILILAVSRQEIREF